MARHDAILIGGGVIGAAIAFALAREGLSVLLIERDQLGRHASRVAAGMLAPVTETLIAEPEAMLEPGLCSLSLFVPFAEEARELSGIDPGYAQSGVLHASSEAEAPLLCKRAEVLAPHGSCWLSREAALELEPRLDPGIAGAVWNPREARVDSVALVRAFAAAAAARGRVRFELGSEVTGLVREGARVSGVQTSDAVHTAAEVVLCTGAWAGSASDWIGWTVPVEPLRGQILCLDAPEPQLAAIVWGHGSYLVPTGKDGLLVGATQERVGFEVRNTAGGLATLTGQALRLVPALEACGFRDARAGLRSVAPDRLPLIGRIPGVEGFSVAVGHHRHGVLLAPLTALAIADLLVRGERDPRLEPFSPARFTSAAG
ncbi:MAG: glycine oxidase ThiO [Myxococcales bacterium]|nr:glycine oxidase ThiO [Myxococcales bacterium]